MINNSGATTTVFTDLLRRSPTTRAAITRRVGLSGATVSRSVEQLIEDGLVEEGDEIIRPRRGRRAVTLRIAAERSHVVGVDLGASNLRVALADLVGRTVAHTELPTPAEHSPEGLARHVVTQARELSGERWRTVEAFVVGLPGSVDEMQDSIANANNLSQIEDPQFALALRSSVQVPVIFANDADLALLGEMQLGAARLAASAAMLTLGAGLGAALAYRGTIIQGPHGIVGELGQIPLNPTTRLEDRLTGPGILAAAKKAGLSLASPAEIFTNRRSESRINDLRTAFDDALILALTAVTVACEPEMIILGGRVSAALDDLRTEYADALRKTIRYAPRLVPPQLGAFSGAVGATVRGLHHVYRELGVNDADLVNLPQAQPKLGVSSTAPPAREVFE